MKKSLKKSLLTFAATLLAGTATFAPVATFAQSEAKLPASVSNEGEAVEGATFKYAMGGANFKGQLNNLSASDTYDMTITNFFNPGLYGHDENFRIDDSGFAKLAFDKDKKTVTITIPKDAKWDDGQPITIDDVIFPYYVVGHKDYPGVRYDEAFTNVVGMAEYHEGKAEEITGLKRIDDYTLEITYLEFTPSLYIAGGGVSTYIEPKHAFEGVEVKDLESAEVVTKKPVGFGPFKVKSITPGESVSFEPNEYYYKGKVGFNLDVEMVSEATIIEEMKAGRYDYAALPTDKYDTYKDSENFSVIGIVQNTLNYVGFNYGVKAEDGTRTPYAESPVNNKALRQAMAYAVDNNAVAEKFYLGLREGANSIIPSFFGDVHDASLEGYTYQPEKAKEVLEAAGFKDTNGDGFVEDPNGKEFKLNVAAMDGGEIAEPFAQYYISSWQAVGINAGLYNDRLLEFNAFYDTVKSNPEDLHVYLAAVGFGGDPNPSNLLRTGGGFNYSNYSDAKNDELIAALTADAALDAEVRKQAFFEWQAYANEELPIIPMLYRYNTVAVNKRVSAFDLTTGSDLDWVDIKLTAAEPIK
ncbi:MAG: oligopeptide ABC transporter substrate-binding protein [Aerococcaceae bacterium]|nr:oligopeptide ABC transporter substrate-binding protein [Aerococcaceae bacterium]